MRSHPSSWTTTLAKLGFRRMRRKSPGLETRFGRTSRIERLEERQLLSITVSTLADEDNGIADGRISLREAIANAGSYGGQVEIDPTLHGGTIRLELGQLNLTSSISIFGPGPALLTIDAHGASRVFAVGPALKATISGVTITGGGSVTEGAGIYSVGWLELQDVAVIGNQTTWAAGDASFGGGVRVRNDETHDDASLTVKNSTIDGNRATFGGGLSVYLGAHGVLDIFGSTISNNVAANSSQYGRAGALQLGSAAPAASTNIRNTTISGNEAPVGAGVFIESASTALTISSGTIVDNVADVPSSYGGGISITSGAAITLQNTIVARNFANLAAFADVHGSVVATSSYNFIGAASGIGISNNSQGNQIGVVGASIDPKLTPLGDHGGTTRTHVPLPGSPVIDKGYVPTVPADPDQRGYSRAADRTEPNGFSTVEVGAVELSRAFFKSTGDFNGDGREDELLFDPVTKAVNVVASSTLLGGFDIQAWGTLPSDAGNVSFLSFLSGDFNGDGRDDVLVRTYAYFHVAISDGSSFIVHEQQNLPGYWADIYAADIDGDGDDDLVAWNSSTAIWGFDIGWNVAKFVGTTGKFVRENGLWNASAGDAYLFREGGDSQIFLADANRDGRADLIRRTAAMSWGVALSQPLAGAATSGNFVYQSAWNTNWFNGYLNGGVLHADAPIQKIIDTFSDVYNNFELEVYAGFMKGAKATSETKAANPWELASLLVDQLEAAGFDADIASGTVQVPIDVLRQWIGVDELVSITKAVAFSIIQNGFDGKAIPLDASETDIRLYATDLDTIANQLQSVRFRHAWVRVKAPGATGAEYFELDPSWKFKDRQLGRRIDLSQVLPGYYDPPRSNISGRSSRESFDELGFLADAGANQLPIGWYEEQLMDYLSATSNGSSLAEIAYDGPIIHKLFANLSAGQGAAAFKVNPVEYFPNFAYILNDTDPVRDLRAELTHRMTVSVAPQSAGGEPSSAVPLGPLYDYSGYATTGGTGTNVTFSASAIDSYGQTIKPVSFGSSDIAPYLPLDGKKVDIGTGAGDVQAIYTAVSNQATFQQFGIPGAGIFRTSGPSDYAAVSALDVDSANPDGSKKFGMIKASAVEIKLPTGYQFPANTHMEFDVRQWYNPGHETYDPFLALVFAVYDSGGILNTSAMQVVQLDGVLSGQPSPNNNIVAGNGQSNAPWKTYTANVPSLASGNYRLFVVHSDNDIISYRQSHLDETPPATLTASGQTTISRIRLRTEGTGEYALEFGNPSPPPGPYYFAELDLTGNAAKTQPVYHVIKANTKLQFTFRSDTLGLAHYIGVDTNNTFNDTGYERLPFAGSAITAQQRKYTQGDSDAGVVKTLTIDLGTIPGLLNQTINRLVFGADDAGDLADSQFKNIRLCDDYTYTLSGNELVFNGTSQQAMDVNYNITPNTIIEFDFSSTQAGFEHTIGWDTDGTVGNGSDDQTKQIKFYGNTGTWPYPGSGTHMVQLRAGDYMEETAAVHITKLLFTANGGNSHYSNVRLYELQPPVNLSDGYRLIGDQFKALPLPSGTRITPRSYLEFDYTVTTRGKFHGIGWDTDATKNQPGSSSERVFRLSGTDSTGYTYTNIAGYDAVGTYHVTLPLGQYIGGFGSLAISNLTFLNDEGNVTYRNLRLGEYGLNGDDFFSQQFVTANPQTGFTTDLIQLGYDNSFGLYRPFLDVNGSRAQTGVASRPMFADETVKISTQHYYPTLLAKSALLPDLNVHHDYVRDVGQVHALVVDANQYSQDYIVSLQAQLNAQQSAMFQKRIDGQSSIGYSEVVDVVGDLLSYAGAKYWHDFNTYNDKIDGYLRAVGVQPRVGSGLLTGNASFMTGQSASSIGYLNFPNVPTGLGVDFPNWAHASYNGMATSRDMLSYEALQMIGFNSSSLENAVIEEGTNQASISTMRGLSNAYHGLAATNSANAADDVVLVYESVKVNGVRTIYFRGEVGANANATRLYDPTRINMPRTATDLFDTGNGQGELSQHRGLNASNSTSQAKAMVDILVDASNKTNDAIRILVPKYRSKISATNGSTSGSWSGSVYAAEYKTAGGWSGTYKIASDVGPVTNGAFGVGVFQPKNLNLKEGTFKYQTWAGDPVNIANGNMFRDETDIVFPNIGVPLTFSRHYDSSSIDDFGMGVGWTYSFGDLLYSDSKGTTTLTDDEIVWVASDGQRHVFKQDGAGGYLVPSSLQGPAPTVVTSAADGQLYFTFKGRDGIEYRFERTGVSQALTQSGRTIIGRLATINDRNGNGVKVNYLGANSRRTTYVQEVHNVGGAQTATSRRLEFTYDADTPAGVITLIKKYDAATTLIGSWNYGYTNVAVTGVTSIKRLAIAAMPTVEVVNPAYQSSLTTPFVSYDYYMGASDPLSSKGRIKRITEADSAWHEYEYYSNARVFRVRQGDAGQSVNDPKVEVQAYNYNLFRNLTEFTDERDNVETYIHQANGLLEQQIHPDRSRQQYTWGTGDTAEEFLLKSTTDERGAIETFAYYGTTDPAFKQKQLKDSTVKHYPSEAAPLTTHYDYSQPISNLHIANIASVVVDPAGRQLTTAYVYDDIGRLTLTRDAEHNEVSRSYYSTNDLKNGLLQSVTDGRRHAGDVPDEGLTNVDYDNDASAVAWRVLASNIAVNNGALTVEASLNDLTLNASLDAIRIDRIVNGRVVETRIIDDDLSGSSAGFSLTFSGGYSFESNNKQTPRYGGDATDVAYATTGAATWAFTDLESGQYRVSATWIEYGGRQPSINYKITGQTITNVPLDQRVAPDAVGTWFDEYTATFDYDPAGNVISTSTSDGHYSGPSTYNSFGQVVQRVDPTGVVTESIYDSLGRLKETGYADSNAAIDPLDRFASKFKYDASGRVRESVDPLGGVTRFEYDGRGRLLKQINADGTSTTHEYDAIGNCIAKTDELGRTTRFVYDSRNRLIQTIHADGASERTRYDGAGNVVASVDALGAVTTFAYDAAGRVTQSKLPDPVTGAATGSNPTTTNKYDILGRHIESIDPVGNVTQFFHDNLGRVTRTQTLAKSNANQANRNNSTPTTLNAVPAALSTIDYDANGNVRRTVVYDVTQLTLPQVQSDPRELISAANIAANKVHVVTTTYDAFNRPLEVVNADSTSTRVSYDAAGRVRRSIDELGRVSTLTYDAFGRLATSTQPDPDGAATALAGPVTTYQYDAAGNQRAVTDPRGFTTRFQYDAFNRVAATANALGGQSHNVYNAVGQLVIAADALNRAAYTLYDNRGRAVLQSSPDPDAPGGTGKALPSTTHRKYDADGRVTEEIDPRGTLKKFEYDALGRLRFERTTLAEIVDDGDADFTVKSGTGAPQPGGDASYSGDETLIQPASGGYAVARWTFKDLPAGTYRLAGTWTADPAASTVATVRVIAIAADNSESQPSVGGAPYYNQNLKAPAQGLDRYEEGAARGWREIDDVVVLAGGTYAIQLESNAPLHADAIRLERVITRELRYDANGNLLTSIDEIGTATTDPNVRRTVSTYDELNRVTSVTLPRSGEVNPLVSQNLLPAPQTTNTYDGYGNVVRVVEARNYESAGAAAGMQATTYKYDLRNRRTRETFDAGTDGIDFTGGSVPSLNYINQRNTFQYDLAGNLRWKSEQAEVESGSFETLRVTGYQYDSLDRITKETFNWDLYEGNDSVNERVTVTDYDAAGNVVKVRHNPLGNAQAITSTYNYDAAGRQIEASDSANVNWTTEVRTTRFMFDAVGNQIGRSDPLNRISRSEYDRLDRLTKSIDPDPDGLGTQAPHFTTFQYDAGGNLVRKSNGNVDVDRFEYDSLGRQVRATDGRGDVTRRRYDDVGNLTLLVDAAANRTTYKYDNLNRRVAETDEAGKVRKTVFDSFGRAALTVDKNGRAIRRWFDRLDRPTQEWWYASEADARVNDTTNISTAHSDVIDRVYDGLGRLQEERDTHRKLNAGAYALDYRVTDAYKYDGLDRVIEHSNQSGVNLATLSTTGAPAVKQTYTYFYSGPHAEMDRRQYIANASGAWIQLTTTTTWTSAFGELEGVTEWDEAGSEISFERYAATFAFDKSGALTATSRFTDFDAGLNDYRNEVKTTYAYDDAGRLKNLSHDSRRRTTAPWPGFTPLVSFGYTYDAADRIKRIDTDWSTSLAAFSTRADETLNLHYDDAGQLTQTFSTEENASSAYVYGPNGNRNIAAEPAGGLDYYTPGAQNRVSQDSTYSYQYDNEGNLTRRTWLSNGRYEAYTWDHRNRLTRVQEYDFGAAAPGYTHNYRYDVDGNLVTKIDEGDDDAPAPTYYVVEGGRRTMELGESHEIRHRYSFGAVGDPLFDQFNGPSIYTQVLLGDHQNSTRVIAANLPNQAITIDQSMDYDPFGAVRQAFGIEGSSVGPNYLGTAFGWHGLIFDTSTNLWISAARWYSPDMGRFISVDPIEDGTNWYAFAGNDPINFADPTGFSPSFHPLNNLAGGYSGNKTSKSSVPGGTLSGPTIGAPSVLDQLGAYARPANRGGQSLGSFQTIVDPYSSRLVSSTFNLDQSRGSSLSGSRMASSSTPYGAGTGIVSNNRAISLAPDLGNASLDARQIFQYATPSNSSTSINVGLSPEETTLIGQAAQFQSFRAPRGPLPGFDANGNFIPIQTTPSLSADTRTPERRQYALHEMAKQSAANILSGRGEWRDVAMVHQFEAEREPSLLDRWQAAEMVAAAFVGIQRPNTVNASRARTSGGGYFGTPGFGTEVHQEFHKALVEQTGTKPSDWIMRTGPGQRGVDATYIGPPIRDPGFQHADLKPEGSERAFKAFMNQLNNWQLPPEQTQLWFYNENGIIGSTGNNY